MSSTVLIAAPEHLPALTESDDFRDALAFSDAETLRALEVITKQRPNLVALERMFASTPRGAALINRIRADPKLRACEVLVVSLDRGRPAPTTRGDAEAADTVGVALHDPPPLVIGALDQRGTRRAPRFRVGDPIEVFIDGRPATLVDVSVLGVQVVSPTILKPNQRVRFSIPDAAEPLRTNGGIVWAAFEIPKQGARYRAGLQFSGADPELLERFIEGYRPDS